MTYGSTFLKPSKNPSRRTKTQMQFIDGQYHHWASGAGKGYNKETPCKYCVIPDEEDVETKEGDDSLDVNKEFKKLYEENMLNRQYSEVDLDDDRVFVGAS